jgi:hypothetical protein
MLIRRPRWFVSHRIIPLAAALLATSGCSHTLEVKNLDLYKPAFVSNRNTGEKIGLSSVTSMPEEERLVTAVANTLKRDGFLVTYPFYPSDQSSGAMDYLIKLSASSQYKGSGWNFLINWPGFILWAPAWHGYIYRAVYTFDVDITNSRTGVQLPRLSIPVDLDIRHADIGRTWTEISWLEWSVIAFAGGLVFIRYDRDITPQLIAATENRIADYVASKIASTLVGAKESLAMKNGRAQPLRLSVVARGR